MPISITGLFTPSGGADAFDLLTWHDCDNHNWAANAAPGIDNDINDYAVATGGYVVGSLWIDTTADKAYICLDNTNHAAVWTEITVAATAGPTGPTGSQGSQGTQGTAGAAGATGSQGTQGTQGTAGAAGATGSQGSQGSQGTQGTAGATGSQGSQGTQGTAGAAGATGSQGSQGTQGTAGAAGPTGSQGSQGTAGAAGPTGSQGSQGTQGTVGATGPTGPIHAQVVTGVFYAVPASTTVPKLVIGPMPFAGTFVKATIKSYNVATVGGLYVDIHKQTAANEDTNTCTTVFTTQTNRPTIANAHYAGNTTTFEVSTFAKGDWLCIYVDVGDTGITVLEIGIEVTPT